MGKSLHEDKDFCNFVFGQTIVCRAAYAHLQLCISAITALHTRVSSTADNRLMNLKFFDKIK